MSWSLNASGSVPAATPADPADPNATAPQSSAEVEMELYEALREVLTDPKYGTAASSFGGSHVSGSLNAPDA